MGRRSRNDGFALDLVKGAVAGAVATKVLETVGTYLYGLEDGATRRREEQVRPKEPVLVAAEKLAAATGTRLGERQLGRLGTALHWATGIGGGVLYALLRRRVSGVASARGLWFGLAFFLLVDELANWALRLTPGPTAFPWPAHARGLATHVAYGVAAETALDVLDRVA